MAHEEDINGGYVPTQALVNNGNPQPLYNPLDPAGSFIGALTNLPAGLAPGAVVATYANGAVVPGSTSVITEQVWFVRKKITNVTDEFRLNYGLRQWQYADRRLVCWPITRTTISGRSVPTC